MRRILGIGLLLALVRGTAVAGGDAGGDDLTRLSLGELARVDVTSVSKAPESLQLAPASIYVITHEDIARSGAHRLPEALRLAPNLLVTQLSASSFEVAARGLGGNPHDQNFSNKMLILVDGRSAYSPLFSGVYTDALDVLLEDVERIEVISGSGATLWGANAMNGVINIVTRTAYLGEGAYAGAYGGNREQGLEGRQGMRTGDGSALRVYAMAFHRAAEDIAGGTAHDGWSKGQAGFRWDWSQGQTSATVQGDFYRGTESQAGNPDQVILGGNALARWRRRGERSDLEVQAYFDQSERVGPFGTGSTFLHTYDLEIQDNLALASWNHLIVGAGERVNVYTIENAASLLFAPRARSMALGNVFFQDTVTLARGLNVSGGLKMEDDPFSGWSALPDLRVSYQLSAQAALWASASRAIRSPTPFDRDVLEKVGPVVFLTGGPDFRPERVITYELGTRL